MAASRPDVNVIVSDRHTDAAQSLFNISPNAETIYFDGPNQNFELELREIRNVIRGKMNNRLIDLYKIAAAVYVSDLRISRPEKIRSRRIQILISVADKSKWDVVKDQLESMIHFISGDHVTFHFVQGDPADSAIKFIAEEGKSVCLFSGGLDSLAGVKWLKDKGITPILVSHCAQNRICHAQTILSKSLRKIFKGKLGFIQVSARWKPGKKMETIEYSQATRSFLFLSLASVVSLGLGIPRIRIFENGILGLNIPIVPSRIFNNTRTVHPSFLTKYNKLMDAVFPHTISVENPFIEMTKGEVVKLLDDPDFKPLVKDSVSCSRMEGLRWSGVANTKHCGICLPCALRRVSVHRAGLDSFDDTYADNIFGDYDKIPQEGRTMLFQILEFGRSLQAPNDELMIEIPQFFIEEMADPSQAIDMTRRYIAEVKGALRAKGSQSLQTKLAQKLA